MSTCNRNLYLHHKFDSLMATSSQVFFPISKYPFIYLYRLTFKMKDKPWATDKREFMLMSEWRKLGQHTGSSQSYKEDLVKTVIQYIAQAGTYICLCLLSYLLLLKLGYFVLEAHCIFLNKHISTLKGCLKGGRNGGTLAMTISSDLKDTHNSKCFTSFLKHVHDLIRSGFTEAKMLRFASLHCLKLTLHTLCYIISILS